MGKKIEFNKYTEEQILELQSKNHRWTAEEIDSVYRLARFALKNYYISYKNLEDEVQDCVTAFFSKILPSYKYNTSTTITSYSIQCMKNLHKNKVRSKQYKFENSQKLSIEQMKEDHKDIPDHNQNPERYVLQKEAKEFMEHLAEKYPIIKGKLQAKSDAEIGKDIGVSKMAISIRKRKIIKLIRDTYKDPDKEYPVR